MLRRFSKYVFASIILACSLTLVGCAREAAVRKPPAITIPEPLDIALEDVMVCVTIPDVGTALEHMEAIAAEFAPPGEFQPGMLKMQLGTVLGDSGLIHLDAAMPLVLMVFKPDAPMEPPAVAGFMTHNEEAPYSEALTNMGMQHKVNDGVLTLAQTPEALAKAETAVSAYRQIAAAQIKNDLRVTLHMDRVMDTYGEFVRWQLEQVAGMMAFFPPPTEPGVPGPETFAQTAKIMKLLVKGLFAFYEQLDIIQCDVNLGADAIEFDEIVAAKAGSTLAESLSARPVGRNRALGLLSGPGLMMWTSNESQKESSAFLIQILDQLSEDPDATDLLTPELVSVFTDWSDCYTGEAAMTMRHLEGATFVSETVMGVKNEAKCLELTEKSMSVFGPDSAFGKIFADMGMEISFAIEKEARNHAGVSVHRLKTTFDMKNVPEMQAAQMEAMIPDQEFAIAEGYYLESQDPAGLDRMIDRALTGAPSGGVTLQAMQTFGREHSVYFDFDLIAMMKASMEMVPAGVPNPMAGLLGGVTSSEPIVAAASSADGRARIQVRIPLSPFIQMAQRAQTM